MHQDMIEQVGRQVVELLRRDHERTVEVTYLPDGRGVVFDGGGNYITQISVAALDAMRPEAIAAMVADIQSGVE